MSDENDPYYTDAEERREAINTILDCTKYWPSRREHIVFKGLLADIDRLRADLIAEQGYRAAAEEIAKRRGEMVDALIAERDEARREVCRLIAFGFDGPKGAARQRGWDCFDAKEGGA
jgi:hypothetical protein